MGLLRKALKSSLALNLLASALTLFLAGYFWVDVADVASISTLNQLSRVAVVIIGLISVYLIWHRLFPTLPILYLVFTGNYFLYQLLFARSWPIYLILVIFFAMLWLIFPIFHIKRNHGIYFFLLVLVLFEIFLALSYWLVNPISRSLILAISAYLFGGWLVGSEKRDFAEIRRYFVFGSIALLLVILTIHWGI